MTRDMSGFSPQNAVAMTRQFARSLTLLVVLLIAAPIPAYAQAKIGVLTFQQAPQSFRDAFRAGLREYGYIEGKNTRIEWRDADGRVDRADEFAAELVRMKMDVIVASLTPAVQAAKKATNTIPIVMAPAGDPITTGFVTSLAHPGGNITGITNIVADLGGKMLGIIREIQPRTTRVGVYLARTNRLSKPFLAQLEEGAAKIGMHVYPVWLSGDHPRPDEIALVLKDNVQAVVVLPVMATQAVADFAREKRLISVSTGIASYSFVKAGGLIGYGSDPIEHYQRAAAYVAKILKGAKPAELPVEQPTRFELVINARTAKAIGLVLPREVLLGASEVIE